MLICIKLCANNRTYAHCRCTYGTCTFVPREQILTTTDASLNKRTTNAFVKLLFFNELGLSTFPNKMSEEIKVV